MTTPSETRNRQLEWSCPDERHPAHILRSGETEIGSLTYEKSAGARSIAEFEGQRWTFENTGSFHPCVTVRRADNGEVVADFVPNLGGDGGLVSFANGLHFKWKRLHMWSNQFCFRCKEDKSAVCLSQEAARLTSGGKVTICSDVAHRAEAPILVLLAWYLRLLAFERLENGILVCD
jgi:hypothetical protein